MLKKRYIILSGLFILVIGILFSITYNMENVIKSSDGIIIHPEAFSNGTHDFTARVLDKNESKLSTYTAYISGSELAGIPGEELHILVYRVNAQSYEVVFNDVHLGTIGDMSNGRSHIYNSINNFIIHKDIIKDTNSISITTYGDYMSGLERDPIGITDSKTALKIIGNIGFRTNGLTLIGLGMVILGLIISLMIFFLSEKQSKAMIFIALSVLFLAFYSFEYLTLPHLPVSYMAFKKMVIFSLYACIFFLGLTINEYYKNLYIIFLSTAAFIVIALSAVFTSNLIIFKNIYNIVVLSIPVSMVLWFIFSIKKEKQVDEAFIFACSFFNLIIISLADTLLMLITGGLVTMSVITYVLVFSYILIMFLNMEIHRRNSMIKQETRQRSHFYIQSITDHLTGAYNKKHILTMLNDEEPPYTVAMLDLDFFKNTNDTFGHPGGDFILSYLVRKMKGDFRDSDIIGRYGGDEFIVILKGCTEKNAFEIMNRFRMSLESDKIIYKDKPIPITISIGLTYCVAAEDADIILKHVDEALYRAKHSGRNRVSL